MAVVMVPLVQRHGVDTLVDKIEICSTAIGMYLSFEPLWIRGPDMESNDKELLIAAEAGRLKDIERLLSEGARCFLHPLLVSTP